MAASLDHLDLGASQPLEPPWPELVITMAATADFSFITFNWDENDECTRIGFSTQSFYLPELDDDGDSDSDSD